MNAQTTKNLKNAKVGQTVIVPLGMVLPTAVKIGSIEIDGDGQIIGYGTIVEAPGCGSGYRSGYGETVGICLGWN